MAGWTRRAGRGHLPSEVKSLVCVCGGAGGGCHDRSVIICGLNSAGRVAGCPCVIHLRSLMSIMLWKP